jgi:hypothetical protein
MRIAGSLVSLLACADSGVPAQPVEGVLPAFVIDRDDYDNDMFFLELACRFGGKIVQDDDTALNSAMFRCCDL